MKRISLLLLSFLLFSLKLTFAQERAIEGFVYIDQEEPAEMALVALHSDSITSHPTLVTYTDKRGYYHINLNPPFAKQYLLEVRYVGYKATTTEIEGENIQGTGRYDFNLETTEPAAQLQEVVVTAKQKMGIDSKSYRFSREQIKQAQSSLDLALTLPQIKAEARTGRIASATGEATPLILINGHYATNEEL
ncbi:carboxypeptidase-like regulatory domain-containing protein, partial [Porphyromonas sp.]